MPDDRVTRDQIAHAPDRPHDEDGRRRAIVLAGCDGGRGRRPATTSTPCGPQLAGLGDAGCRVARGFNTTPGPRARRGLCYCTIASPKSAVLPCRSGLADHVTALPGAGDRPVPGSEKGTRSRLLAMLLWVFSVSSELGEGRWSGVMVAYCLGRSYAEGVTRDRLISVQYSGRLATLS